MSISTNRHLTTLIRSLQTYTQHQDTPKLLSTAASLLTVLSNPHNLTLLTSQLLSAPALWAQPEGLKLCLRFLGAFQSAAFTVYRKHNEENSTESEPFPPLHPSEWIRGVLLGADDRTPVWRHVLLIGGLLRGFLAEDPEALSQQQRQTIENAFVNATNTYLAAPRVEDDLGGQCVTLVLNYSFQLLPDNIRAQLDYDRLLPVLVSTTFFSDEGYRAGYFLGGIDDDLKANAEGRLFWPSDSPSHQRLRELASQPLVSTMGPLSRLLAHAIENVQASWLIQAVVDDLETFSRTLHTQWRRNKMSETSPSRQSLSFDATTVASTLPKLWTVLRSALFAFVIVLRSVVGRAINDRALSKETTAPELAVQVLNTLRNLHFISSRLGSESLTEYSFVFFTVVDILSAYPSHVESLVKEIHPTQQGQIPAHPVDRDLDLFFFNVAEQFTLSLSPRTNEDFLVAAALPYLDAGAGNDLVAVFEAAHSVMLAVFSAPQNVDITLRHVPFYIDVLFKSYPSIISQRQFRLAFKTLVMVSAPPSAISAIQPDLSEVLLDILHSRAASSGPTTADEKPGLVLTLIDALPLLPASLLEEWLTVTANLINQIQLPMPRQKCRDRFWEVLSDGSMDVEKSRLCVAWWATRSGRELTLIEGNTPDPYTMSGANNASHGNSKM